METQILHEKGKEALAILTEILSRHPEQFFNITVKAEQEIDGKRKGTKRIKRGIIKELSENPIEIDDFKPLSRDEIYER